jgi:hypothetical protein
MAAHRLYLGWVAASWVIAAFFPDFMRRLTPAVAVATPTVLALILIVGFTCESQAPETC